MQDHTQLGGLVKKPCWYSGSMSAYQEVLWQHVLAVVGMVVEASREGQQETCAACRYGALADIEAAIQAKVKSLPPDSMLSAEVRCPLLPHSLQGTITPSQSCHSVSWPQTVFGHTGS